MSLQPASHAKGSSEFKSNDDVNGANVATLGPQVSAGSSVGVELLAYISAFVPLPFTDFPS